MKIGSIENQAAASPAVTERKAAGAAAAAPATAEPSAKVALSPAVQIDHAESVFDAGKVKRISEAIRDGKFTVDADAIADKLISNAQDLLGKVQKR